MKELKLTSRTMPDTALTTYWGKPTWHAYGNGNTNPTYGGPMYGNYMLSHNVNPHVKDNHPEEQQVYNRAMMGPMVMQTSRNKEKKKKGNYDKNDMLYGTLTRQALERLKRDPKPPRIPLGKPAKASAIEVLEAQQTRNPILQNKLPKEKLIDIKPPRVMPDPRLDADFKLKAHAKKQ